MSNKEYTTQVTAQVPMEKVKAIDALVQDNYYVSRSQFIKLAIETKLKSDIELLDMIDISDILDHVERAGYVVER